MRRAFSSPAGKRADGAALALLVALAAAYLAPVLVGGKALLPVEMLRLAEPWKSETPEVANLPPPNVELSDALWEVLPMAEASARAWRSGVPLWNPYLMLGAPALASGKMYSNPIFVPLAFFLDPIEALDWTAFLQLAIAGCGMFLLLRQLGCRTLAAVAGALVFELNTPFLRWLSLPFIAGSIAWTPWVFLGLERAVSRRRPAWAALAAAAFALQLLSGYILVSYFCGLAAAVRFGLPLFRAARARAGREAAAILLTGAIGLGGGAALAAFQVLPSLELFRESVRGQAISPSSYFSPRAAFTLLAPRTAGLPDEPGGMDRGRYASDELPLFFGVVPLALALLAIAAFARRGAPSPSGRPIYPVLALVAALGAWGVPGAAEVARLVAPMLNSSSYSRIWSWVIFAAAVSVGLGLERLVAGLEKGGSEARFIGGWAIGIFGFVATSAFVTWCVAEAPGGDWIRHPEELAHATIWGVAGMALVAAALARRLPLRLLLALFAFAPALDLALAIRGWNRFDDPRLALPETPTIARLAEALAAAPPGDAPRALNVASMWTLPGRTAERFGIEVVSGYSSWMLKRVSMFGWATHERANASVNHLYFESCCRALLDSLGARFVLAGSDLHEEIDPTRSLRSRIRNARFRGPERPAFQALPDGAGGRESWLLQHPPSRLEIPLPRSGRVGFSSAIGIRPDAIRCPTDGVSFSVRSLEPEGERELFHADLDPVRRPEDRVPRRFELDLATLAPRATGLVLETGPGPAGNLNCDWAGWISPRFVLPTPDPLRKIHDGPNPIFENLDALPRAWIVHEAELRPPGDLAGVKAAIMSSGFAPKRQAIIESAAPLALALPVGAESAQVRERAPERMTIELAVSAPALLVVSDAFYPGWRATVDGVERPILAANLALRAVAVAPGDREVVFRYRPLSYSVGAWISTGALALVTAWLLAALARRRPMSASGTAAVAATPPPG